MKTKRFYKLTSIILAIMLVMSCICPTLSVSASTAPTYVVAGVIDLCGVVWRGNTEEGADNIMTKNADGTYSKVFTDVAVKNDYQLKVVANDAAGNMTWYGIDGGAYNFTFHVVEVCDVTVTFDPETLKITVTGDGVEIPTGLDIESIRTVGNGDGTWLNGVEWNPADDSNLMTEISPNVYEITYNDIKEFDNYQVKFATNGSWAVNWGGVYEGLGVESEAEYNSDNSIIFDVPYELANVTITLDLSSFNYATKTGAKFTVTVVDATLPEVSTPPATEATESVEYVNIFGDINLELAYTGTKTYSKTTYLDAGSYQFRINDNGTTKCFGYTFTDGFTNVAYSSSYASATTLNATGGNYTFTYNTDTDRLSVTHQAMVEPTTVAPTTEPVITVPNMVDPTTVPVDTDLTVTATSNLFPTAQATFNEDESQVTVTYMIESSKDMLNCQWKLIYDPEVLSFNTTANRDSNGYTFMPEVTNGDMYNTNYEDNVIFGNASSLWLYPISGKGSVTFVTCTFDIIGTGSTTVDLLVEVLTVSQLEKNSNMADFDYNELICDKSIVQDYTCEMSFETIINGKTDKTETEPVETTPEETAPTTEAVTTVPNMVDPTTVPVITIPNTVIPTTEPITTVPPTTEPVVVDELTVNATSNLFTSQSATYDSKTKKLTVTYWIQSTKDMLNTQWEMTYDPEVLTVSKENNTANSVCPAFTSGRVLTIKDGIIKFNALNISLFDISSDETVFARVVFDVKDFEELTTNNTTVDLNVINLTVSSLDSSTSASDENEEVRVVYNGEYDDSYGLIVSERIEMVNTEIPNYIGDADGSDIIDIHDATLIAKYLADLKELTAEQLLVSDCDGDGIVSVKDVTCIQLYLADGENSGNTGQKYNANSEPTTESATEVETIPVTNPTVVYEPITINLYFKHSGNLTWTPYLWIWGTDNNGDNIVNYTKAGRWPGDKVTDTDGDGWFEHSFTMDSTSIYNIIVSENGSLMTIDYKGFTDSTMWVVIDDDNIILGANYLTFYTDNPVTNPDAPIAEQVVIE